MRLTLFLAPFLLLAPQSAAAADSNPTAAKPGQAQPADKVICKKRVKTGTLAQYEKSCHTRAEWEKKRAEAEPGSERRPG